MIVDINSIREKTKERIKEKKIAEIQYINEMIIKTAEDGRWSFEVPGLYQETTKLLKDAGYHIQITSYNCIISWQ